MMHTFRHLRGTCAWLFLVALCGPTQAQSLLDLEPASPDELTPGPDLCQILEDLLEPDGSVESRSSLSLTFDQAGRLVEEATDDQNDGIADRFERWVYDTDGRLTLEERSTVEGGVQSQITYTYDDSGRPLVTREDRGGDGTFENVTIYAYDLEGRLWTVGRDAHGDGLIDRTIVLGYDAAHRVEFSVEIPSEDDEEPVRYRYDGVGRLVSTQTYTEWDGELITTYTYDETGHLTRQRQSHDSHHGEVEHFETYRYDDLGQLVEHESWAEGDAVEDSVERSTFEYDSAGRRQQQEFYYDDELDSRTTYVYDCE